MFNDTAEYEEWVEGIARVWHEDFERTEPLEVVVKQCIISYTQPGEDQATLNYGGSPWTKDRAAPTDVLARREDGVPTGCEDLIQAARVALMDDILRAANRIRDGPDPSVGDVIAFDEYDDGHGVHHLSEPTMGVVQGIGDSGTIRARGIGAVDVEPESVVEIVNPEDLEDADDGA